MGLFYGDLFAAWEIAIAKSAIINFQKNYPWPKGFEFEDLAPGVSYPLVSQPSQLQRRQRSFHPYLYGKGSEKPIAGDAQRATRDGSILA